MKNLKSRMKLTKVLAGILMAITMIAGLNIGKLQAVSAAPYGYQTIYLVDNTNEKWIKDDNASIEVVDYTRGQDSYWMSKVDDTTWGVVVPDYVSNISFNRRSTDGKVVWNNWNAGAKNGMNTYFADGNGYGHWANVERNIKCFHAGDVVYLDVNNFTDWKKDSAYFFACFTDEKDNFTPYNNMSIRSLIYNGIDLTGVYNQVEKNVYKYVVTASDEGKTELRFFRGNNSTLWNYSASLSYSDYAKGLNCVTIYGWDNNSACTYSNR